MSKIRKAHLLFEQSGTFKNEFKKLGIEAYDYDIKNEFNETDYVVDLFKEIRGGYEGKENIFDKFSTDDVILAFFPCTRFEAKVPLLFRGEAYQQQKWSLDDKLKYSMELHKELHRNYLLISELVLIANRKNLKMVIENPYTAPHYLTTYWCIRPTIIDKDRRENGDYYKKPTQYWFINFNPQNNFIFEPIEYVEQRRCDYITKGNTGLNRTVARSMIHPQYASRFIRQYIIDGKELDEFGKIRQENT